MDDLDLLLNELESDAPIKRESSNNVLDLDGLITELSDTKPNPSITQKNVSHVSSQTDLDSLISELNLDHFNGTSNTTSNSGSKNRSDDLDSLIQELEAPKPNKTNPKKQEPTDSKYDDLDSLISSLENPSKVSVNPKQPVNQHLNVPKTQNSQVHMSSAPRKPSGVGLPPQDDLDELLSSISSPPSKPKDDLDSLLEDLEKSSSRPSTQNTQQRMSTPQTSRSNVGQTVNQPQPYNNNANVRSENKDDLDSLLEDLEKSSSGSSIQNTQQRMSSPQTSRRNVGQTVNQPQPYNNNANVRSENKDDLDSLLEDLESSSSRSSLHNPPPTQSYSNSPPTHTNPQHNNPGSRFSQFINEISSNVSDLSRSPLSKGVCFRCGLDITGEAIKVLGRVYHPEHFDCAVCKNTIGTRNFYDVKGEPNCEQCYQKLFCPQCFHCGNPIVDKCVTALNKKYHLQCFVCTQCLQPFSGSFYEKDQRPYCEKCYHTIFSARCRACNQPIYGDCVNALGSQWHPEHFNCQYCHKAFTGMFFELDGMPYCETHYYQQMGDTCHGCDQPIAGASVEAMGKKWHPEHFVCSFCMNPLSGSSFAENKNKPYCKPCYAKLF